jgi:hypothetical protein
VQEALGRNVVLFRSLMFGNHMLLVTRMLESGDAPEAEVARSWHSFCRLCYLYHPVAESTPYKFSILT